MSDMSVRYIALVPEVRNCTQQWINKLLTFR
jgi:hypothetical protein